MNQNWWRSLFSSARLTEELAVLIAVLGTLFAVNSVADANATETRISKDVQATNTYAFYQAKNNRQVAYKLGLDEIRRDLEVNPDLGTRQRSFVDDQIEEYEAAIARYDSEPDPNDPENPLKGEGKVQLLARARDLERQRDEARHRSASFDYGSTFATVGVVLASTAVLLSSRRFALAATSVAVVSLLFTLNGWLQIVDVTYVAG
ncbi:MAG: DUF4337 domain-containing protein [Anaerolineales bacterium]